MKNCGIPSSPGMPNAKFLGEMLLDLAARFAPPFPLVTYRIIGRTQCLSLMLYKQEKVREIFLCLIADRVLHLLRNIVD